MAFTVSQIAAQTVFGNNRIRFIRVTADAAEGVAATGLAYINSIAYAPQSSATNIGKFDINMNSSGASANGTIGISGVVSGDELLFTVFGRR